MTLKEKLFTELDSYVNKEKFEMPHVILNIKNLVTWKTASDEEREAIKNILLNHRISNGIYCRGFRMFLDADTLDIKTEDIHIVNVKVVNKNNRPKAIATFCEDIESIILDGKGFVRTVYMNPDKTVAKIEPIQVIMPATAMDNVFYKSKYRKAGDRTIYEMDYQMIRFSENSIEEYYSFDRTSCVKLTPAMVKKYWNGNDLTLTKYTVNLDSHANGWGLIFPTWSSQIICVDGGVYIDDELTEDEINTIAKGHEDSWIIKDVKQKYKAMHNNDEEDKTKKKEKMGNIIKSIEETINKNDEDIINGIISKLGFDTTYFDTISDKAERMNLKRNFIASKEESFGFDCGFLYFRFKDEELNSLVKEVATYGLGGFFSDGTFILNIPYENQSTTIKRYEAQIIRELISKSSLPEVSYKTVLD